MKTLGSGHSNIIDADLTDVAPSAMTSGKVYTYVVVHHTYTTAFSIAGLASFSKP